ncbi:MAG: hypothetical protein ACX931_00150 [Saccharospirillum sp.]
MLKPLRLFCCLFLLGSATASDFGVATWGDTLAEVRDQEMLTNLTPLTATDYLIYEVELSSIDKARLIYEFTDGRLDSGRFLFWPAETATPAEWIAQFERVRALISQQHQAPDLSETLHPSGVTPPSPAHWAQALAADQLILKNHWQRNGTRIVQQLAWRETSPHHQVIYEPATP